MAVAHDAVTTFNDAGTDPSGTHTPVGTPAGALVYVLANDGAEQTVSVTYGGTAMTPLTSRGKTSGEPGRVYPFVLLASVPSGAQTVTATCSGADGKAMVVYTVTSGGGDSEVVDEDFILNDALDDPSINLDNLSAKTILTYSAMISGKGADSNVTADANHTKDLADSGMGGTTGNSGISEHRTATTTGNPAVVAWVIGGAADDVIMHAVALTEVTVSGATVTPASIVRTRAFGTAVVTTGPVDISPASIVRTRAFGSLRIDLEVAPPSIVNSRAFGSPTVTQGPANLLPASIVHARAFGSPTVVGEGAFVNSTSVVHERAFGDHTLGVGEVFITAPSIVHERAITSQHVVGEPFVLPQGNQSHSPGAPMRGFRSQPKVYPS